MELNGENAQTTRSYDAYRRKMRILRKIKRLKILVCYVVSWSYEFGTQKNKNERGKKAG